MTRFYKKLLLFISPLLLFVASYFVFDPFKVLYHYDNYIVTGTNVRQPIINFDYMAVENFANKYEKWHYDSYIFGGSRSINFKVATWQKYINSDKTYHLAGFYESLYGIYTKFKYLEARNITIKNAIIVLDSQALFTLENYEPFLFTKHPATSHESVLNFHLKFFKSYFDVKLLPQLYKCNFAGRKNPTPPSLKNYDPESNEYSMKIDDLVLMKDSTGFYKRRKKRFAGFNKMGHTSKPVIEVAQRQMLTEIKTILSNNNTNYKIIISPLLDKNKLNPKDLHYLDSLFGEKNVFDFSGTNEITTVIGNYYDEFHYKPFVADRLMNIIYAGKPIAGDITDTLPTQ